MAAKWVHGEAAEKRRQEMRLLHEQGCSYLEIASRFKLTKQRVSDILRSPLRKAPKKDRRLRENMSAEEKAAKAEANRKANAAYWDKWRDKHGRQTLTEEERRAKKPAEPFVALDGEEWRATPDPKCEVSNLGRFRRKHRDGWELSRIGKKGKGYAAVFCQGKQKALHRLVAMAFLGPPPDEFHVIDHIDSDPSNNAVTNLEWVTVQENSRRAMSYCQHCVCLSCMIKRAARDRQRG